MPTAVIPSPRPAADKPNIEEFCKAHGGLSESMFHKLCREGRGPAIMKVGARTLISAEAAAAWRQALTVE